MTLTASSWPDRATRPGRRIPAVSTILKFRRCHVSIASTVSRVVPGMSLTIDRSSRSIRFSNDDLPTLGRPTMATAIGSVSAGAPRLAARGQPADHFVEQIAGALAVLGGDLHDRLEAEPIELDRPAACALVVGLVNCHDHRRFRAP